MGVLLRVSVRFSLPGAAGRCKQRFDGADYGASRTTLSPGGMTAVSVTGRDVGSFISVQLYRREQRCVIPSPE